MSSNLVADLLVVGLLYVLGQRFLYRRVSGAVYTRIVRHDDGSWPESDEPVECHLEVVNGSTEPIGDVWFAFEKKSEEHYRFVTTRSLMGESLMPGERGQSDTVRWHPNPDMLHTKSFAIVGFKTMGGYTMTAVTEKGGMQFTSFRRTQSLMRALTHLAAFGWR